MSTRGQGHSDLYFQTSSASKSLGPLKPFHVDPLLVGEIKVCSGHMATECIKARFHVEPLWVRLMIKVTTEDFIEAISY